MSRFEKNLFWVWSGIFAFIVALFFILSFISRDRIYEGRLEIKESKVLESSDFALGNIESSSEFTRNSTLKNIESNGDFIEYVAKLKFKNQLFRAQRDLSEIEIIDFKFADSSLDSKTDSIESSTHNNNGGGGESLLESKNSNANSAISNDTQNQKNISNKDSKDSKNIDSNSQNLTKNSKEKFIESNPQDSKNPTNFTNKNSQDFIKNSNKLQNLDSKNSIESKTQDSKTDSKNFIESKTQNLTQDSKEKITESNPQDSKAKITQTTKFQNYKIYNFTHPNNQNKIIFIMPSDKNPPLTFTYKTHFKPGFFLKLLQYYLLGFVLFWLLKIALNESDIKSKLLSENKFLTLKIPVILLLAAALYARFYEYINHKDLWLDEASLSYSMYALPFKDLFFQALPNGQAAPLGFLLLSKIIGAPFNYNEYSLYFLPFISGLFTLFFAYKIADSIKTKNTESNFTSALFITLVCGSLGLLYYCAEFKQYEGEAACAFFLVYLFIAKSSFKKFIFASIFCALFSYTSLFIAFGLGFGYLYRVADSKSLLNFLRANARYIGIYALFILAYYLLYIRYQAGAHFYNYWAEFFLPHALGEYPQFVKDTLLGVYEGFSIFGVKGVPLNALLSAFGLLYLWRNKRDLSVTLSAILCVYVALSLFRIYPFGHAGIIGGRLSLYMSVVFFILAAFGGAFFYNLCKLKFLRLFLMLILIYFMYFSAQHCIKYVKNKQYFFQQTHALIKEIEVQTNLLDSKSEPYRIYVYSASRAALGYYLNLDKKSLKYEIFDKDLQNLKTQLENLKDSNTKVMIFASHYWESAESDLIDLAHIFNKNATITKSQGAILITFDLKN